MFSELENAICEKNVRAFILWLGKKSNASIESNGWHKNNAYNISHGAASPLPPPGGGNFFSPTAHREPA